MRLPDLSPFHALTSETSAVMPGSSTYSLPSKTLCLFAFGQFGAEAGAGVKPGNARAARAQSFGECALRDEFKFEFARQHLALELLVLADVGGHDLLHLSGGEQNAHAEAIHAGVVADDGEAFHAAVVQGGDEIFRYAAEPEPARSDRHVVVEQAGKRSRGVRVNFAHVERNLTTDCTNASGGDAWERSDSRAAARADIARAQRR